MTYSSKFRGLRGDRSKRRLLGLRDIHCDGSTGDGSKVEEERVGVDGTGEEKAHSQDRR